MSTMPFVDLDRLKVLAGCVLDDFARNHLVDELSCGGVGRGLAKDRRLNDRTHGTIRILRVDPRDPPSQCRELLMDVHFRRLLPF